MMILLSADFTAWLSQNICLQEKLLDYTNLISPNKYDLKFKYDQKFEIRRVYARFKDNIWDADLVEMGSLSFKNRGIKYLLCVIDVFTKSARVKLLKDKKAKTVLNGFIGIEKESKHQPNKLWIDQRR